jgi:uncharacterized protein
MAEPNKPAGSMLSRSHVEFVLRSGEEDISGCTLISGFYGIGKVGFIAVNHMVQTLKARLIGYIVTDFLPPFLSVKDERLVLPFEIYRYEDIILINAYFEPYKLEHRSFAQEVVNWSLKNLIEQIILIGGLDSRLRVDEEVLAKAVYTSKYKTMSGKTQLDMMDEGLFITGPMALLLMYSEINQYPAIGIMPYAERSRPDPIAASHAVEIINDLLGLECGIDELIQEAESIENEIQSMEGVLEEDREEDDRNRGMFL